ncbi:hypothetical protein GW17_00046516 [Ensete ventricosum]|nr:hypothetical protein GW17_00046516 [Ensete ventricosum]
MRNSLAARPSPARALRPTSSISRSRAKGYERMLRVSEEEGNRKRESYVESYRQLGRSLLELQRAADRVFDTISRRAAEERDKLTEISRRIQLAKGYPRQNMFLEKILEAPKDSDDRCSSFWYHSDHLLPSPQNNLYRNHSAFGSFKLFYDTEGLTLILQSPSDSSGVTLGSIDDPAKNI